MILKLSRCYIKRFVWYNLYVSQSVFRFLFGLHFIQVVHTDFIKFVRTIGFPIFIGFNTFIQVVHIDFIKFVRTEYSSFKSLNRCYIKRFVWYNLSDLQSVLRFSFGLHFHTSCSYRYVKSHPLSVWPTHWACDIRFNQGGLNEKEIQLNLCNIFSILIFNELYLFV